MSEQNSRPLGDWLRQRREELGISLEQAETDTRIRIRYLEALESESFDALPDPVVGRGFLRNYAVYLGLDPKEASDRFSEKVAPPQPESLSVEGPTPFTTGPFQPVPLHRIAGRRPRWLWIAGAGLVLVVALSLLAWWAYPNFSQWLAQRNSNTPTQTVASVERTPEAELATATRTTTATAVMTETVEATQVPLTLEVTPRATLTPSPSPSPPIYTGIFLELVFTDTSWIQVTVDDVRQFQGELDEDTYRSWYGEERIELRIGSAGVVLVTVNGQSLGTLGAVGEVVDRVFEKAGDDVTEATLTPQPTVDGTGEPPASPTPRPTVVPVTPTIVPPTPPVTATATPTPTATLVPTATLTPAMTATATLTPTVTATATTSP